MKNSDPPFYRLTDRSDQNLRQETPIRPELRSKVIAAGDMLRRIEKHFDAIARMPSRTLLDQEDLEVCALGRRDAGTSGTDDRRTRRRARTGTGRAAAAGRRRLSGGSGRFRARS